MPGGCHCLPSVSGTDEGGSWSSMDGSSHRGGVDNRSGVHNGSHWGGVHNRGRSRDNDLNKQQRKH